MPKSLVFPLIAKFSDWITRTWPTTFEQYLEVKLPSVAREERELKILNEYFEKNNIAVTDNAVTGEDAPLIYQGKIERKLKDHKPHIRLGYGYLAYFMSMRFMFLVFLLMSALMVVPAIFLSNASRRPQPGFTWFFALSIANLNFSGPMCIQQYVEQSTTRTIDCGYGDG